MQSGTWVDPDRFKGEIPRKENPTVGYLDNLAEEFATVDLLLPSKTRTGRTDAFIISWVKVEKQIRRLFVYTVFQFECFSEAKKDKDGIRDLISANRSLYLPHFVKGFNELSPRSLKSIVGNKYQKSLGEISRIKPYRDKILHGQLTNDSLDSAKLQKEVKILQEWVSLIAEKLWDEIEYDGLSNSFTKSQSVKFPKLKATINNIDELREFIRTRMPSGPNGVKWTDIQ